MLRRQNNTKSLLFAIECKDEIAVRGLLESGCSPNQDAENPEVMKPMNMALMVENLPIVKMLIQHGGFAQLPLNVFHSTALQYAVITRHKSLILEVLGKMKGDFKVTDAKGSNVLHMVFQLEKLKDSTSQRKKLAILDSSEEDNIIDIIKIFLTRGLSVNSRTNSGKTPLYLAVKRGMRRVAEFLVENGADVNIRDKRANSLMHLLVRQEHERQDYACSRTITADGSIAPSPSLEIPVEEDLTFMEYLRGKGAHTNWCNKSGKSPLHLAMQYRLRETFLYLFGHLESTHANLSAMDPIWLHAIFDTSNPRWKGVLKQSRVVRTMVERCADIDTVHNGETILSSLIKGCIGANGQHEDGYDEIARFIIDRGVNVNRRNIDDLTPAQLAAKYKHLAILAILLEHRADFNAYASNGDSLLHLAAERSRELDSPDTEQAIAEFLIDRGGCRVKDCNIQGMTALHVAARSSNIGAARALIARGAQVNDLDRSFHKTPLLMAAENGDKLMIDLLLANGAELNVSDSSGATPLHLAAAAGNLEAVNTFLGLGVDVHAVSGERLWTALHVAASTPSRQLVIEALILGGALPNAIDSDGWTPLHVAAERGAVDNARALLDLGIDANHRNVYSRETALHVVARTGDADAMEFLVSRGGDVNARNIHGQMPLHVAASLDDDRRVDTFKMLVRSGAFLDAMDFYARSPLCTAVQFVNSNNLRELVQYNPNLDEIGADFDIFLEIVGNDAQTKHSITRHMTKLKLLNLPVPQVHEVLGWKFNAVQQDLIQECLKEVKGMKTYVIDNRVSLYELLHTKFHQSLDYLDYDLVTLLDIEGKFPVYHGFVWKRYREVIDRKPLMRSMKLACDRIAGLDMPNRCVNVLCGYLKNEYLKDLLESTSY